MSFLRYTAGCEHDVTILYFILPHLAATNNYFHYQLIIESVKYQENSEKCPSQFRKGQGDVIKLLSLRSTFQKRQKYFLSLSKKDSELSSLNIWHFCMKNDLYNYSVIKVVDYFSVDQPINLLNDNFGLITKYFNMT